MSWRDKLCFKDEDLKSPDHDALVIWIYENWKKIATDLYGSVGNNFKTGGSEMEAPISNKHNTILCFIDLLAHVSWDEKDRKDLRRDMTILFEAKPKILSLGETLRQLRSYEHYYDSTRSGFNFDKCSAVIVSPDTRFKSIIEGQGFKFINPDDYANFVQ